jgi:hypothetical protein
MVMAMVMVARVMVAMVKRAAVMVTLMVMVMRGR